MEFTTPTMWALALFTVALFNLVVSIDSYRKWKVHRDKRLASVAISCLVVSIACFIYAFDFL